MDLILQETIDGTKQFQDNLSPGNYAGLRMIITGTNATGQTADLDDLGSVLINRSDDQIVNVAMRQLAYMLDINRGSNLFSSAEAGAFEASITLDFHLRNDPNMFSALNVTGEKELNFQYNPATTVGTVFDDLEIKVYAEYAPQWPELYTLRTLRDNQNEDAAVSSKRYPLNKDNIVAIYMEDPDTAISQVQITQSGRNILSPNPWNLLEAVTAGENQIEDGATEMIKISTYSPYVPRSAANYDTIIYLTTSIAGDFPIVTQSLKMRG